MRILRIISVAAFFVALFIIGFAAGLCVKVFMERGAPVIHGGGELVLLLAIPCAVYAGYYAGREKTQRRRRSDESIGHTD